MKAEDGPITDDEWLLRRVRVELFRTDREPVISPNAFEPRVKGRDPDADGISLYRAACLADPTEVMATIAPDRCHEYAVVRVPVSLLRSMGLNVRSIPDARIRGHVVIPELNAADYQADKNRFRTVKDALAVEASKDENIIRRPG